MRLFRLVGAWKSPLSLVNAVKIQPLFCAEAPLDPSLRWDDDGVVDVAGWSGPWSFHHLRQHRLNPPDHIFQFGVDDLQRARRLEDVEVAVEGNFVTHPGLVVIVSWTRRTGQEKGLR